jgi:hypothetical protein
MLVYLSTVVAFYFGVGLLILWGAEAFFRQRAAPGQPPTGPRRLAARADGARGGRPGLGWM